MNFSKQEKTETNLHVRVKSFIRNIFQHNPVDKKAQIIKALLENCPQEKGKCEEFELQSDLELFVRLCLDSVLYEN